MNPDKNVAANFRLNSLRAQLQASEAARAEAERRVQELENEERAAEFTVIQFRWVASQLTNAAQERDQARSDLAAARESAKSMNRRCQEAESKAAATREAVRAELLAESESRAPGRPMGRMLANFTIEQLRSDLAATVKERDRLEFIAESHRRRSCCECGAEITDIGWTCVHAWPAAKAGS